MPPERKSLPILLVVLALLLGVALALAPGGALAGDGVDGAPSCAEGPQRLGDAIVGTACDDTIVVPPSVTEVDAGPGDDVIRAAKVGSLECPSPCRLGVGSQTFKGGPGNDVVFGERGNDTLEGGEGEDLLFGGIGDDKLLGGPGNDRLYGGFGGDAIDGGAGDDYVRGDATIDDLRDSGGGSDTLSFATAVTPGFGLEAAENNPATIGVAGFPTGGNGERGVRLRLGIAGQNANNGGAALGGGVDEVQPGAFETIIGSPFADYITGTGAAETIYGGGGADVIVGEGGGDVIFGGADGDYIDSGAGGVTEGGAGTDHCPTPVPGCESNVRTVEPRAAGLVSVGLMAPEAGGNTRIYAVGAGGDESVVLTYFGSSVGLSLSGGAFDQNAGDQGSCSVLDATTASCPLAAPLESALVAGMAGSDAISAQGFPETANLVALGGLGDDTLTGGPFEDVLIDGPDAGRDVLDAQGGDDALVHNGGPDLLAGGIGNDLMISVTICDGTVIDGGEGRDNASWARLQNEGVEARLDFGVVTKVGGCTAGELPDTVRATEDLEGSEAGDVMVGDSGPNQLLGRRGADVYLAGPGADNILANSGDADASINCGADTDRAVLDLPQYGDPVPVECEDVRVGNPNEFEALTELPPLPPATSPPAPKPDRRRPQTRITFRPGKTIVAKRLPRRVVFRFTSNEKGSSFQCKLDRRPFRKCVSPRAFTVARGPHLVKIVATDAAGNRDRTPAEFRFKVRPIPRP